MSYLLAFLGFAALIILHEFGHFAAAKAVGMRVERFSLFFGPLLVKFRRGETEYGVGPIPLGGYVRITGMNPREELAEDTEVRELREQLGRLRASPAGEAAQTGELTREQRDIEDRISSLQARGDAIRARAYHNQPVWKRVVVILAGPGVNLAIAFFLIFGLIWSQGDPVTHRGQPVWSVGAPLIYPASTYLKPGDRLVGIDGKPYPSPQQTSDEINRHRCPGTVTNRCQASTPVSLLVRRQGRLITLSIRPRYDAQAGRMRIGFTNVPAYHSIGPVTAAGESVSGLWSVTTQTVSKLATLFEPSSRRQLHSVVGAFKATQQRFSYSVTLALETLGLISLSLAVINLFPFLPLDGGHVFWAVAEKVRGKRIPFEVMERASAIGFALILIVFVIGLSNDISALTGSGLKLR